MSGRALVHVLGAAALLAMAATLALGLSVPDTVQQGSTAPLLAIHPALATVSYLAVAVTAAGSVLYLLPWTRSYRWDRLAGASAEIAVLLTGLVLITGSIWGRATWGVWWAWEARLILTALLFALLLGYLALRRVDSDRDVRARRSAIAALVAAPVVPINHFAVEWWRTLHQGRTLMRTDPQTQADPEHLIAMAVGFLAITLVFAWMLVQRYRVEVLEERLDQAALDQSIAERRRETGEGWGGAVVSP